MGSRSQLAAVRSTSNREKRSIEPATAFGPLEEGRRRARGHRDRDDSGSGIPGTEFLRPGTYLLLLSSSPSSCLTLPRLVAVPLVSLYLVSPAASHLASPHLNSPLLTSPHPLLNSPHLVSPRLTSSQLATTRFNSPLSPPPLSTLPRLASTRFTSRRQRSALVSFV